MADLDTSKRDVKITLPLEAADGLMDAFIPNGPLTPTGPSPFGGIPARPTATSPSQPVRTAPAAAPAATATAPPPASPSGIAPPASASPLGTIAPTKDPATLPPPAGSHLAAVPDRPEPKSFGGKLTSALGKIGGYGLGILAPGIAERIPSTPLGKIEAENRTLRRTEEEAKTGRERAQAEQATAAAGRDTAEAGKATAETKRISEGGKWTPHGEPLEGPNGLVQPEFNENGEGRLRPIDTGTAAGAATIPATTPAAPGQTVAPAPGAGAPAGAATPTAVGATPGSQYKKVGAVPKEGDEPMTPQEIQQANADLANRWAVNNPGKPVPPEYTLPANALAKDYTRVDKALEAADRATTSKSVRENTKATQDFNRTEKQRLDDERKQKDLDREVDKARESMNKDVQPIVDKIETLNEAMGMLDNPNGMKDALVVVKGLVASAGGRSSGVRITQPEINRIAGARGVVGSVEALINKAINGETLTDTQRTQLRGVLEDIRSLVQSKMDVFSEEMTNVTNAGSVADIRKAQTNLTKRINELGKQGATGGAAAPKVGDVVKGYKFKGGEPSDKSNWEKVSAERKTNTRAE